MATTIQKYIYALFSIIVLLCSCDPLLVPQSGTQAYGEDANGHKYVDLGLSVKWAAYDIGAKSAAEHGSFFAWGETQPKDKYSWENYKYAAPRKEYGGDTRAFDDEYEMTKYNIDGGSEYYDGKTTLELMDDAAHMAWGGNWRMPTADECEELLEKCEWTWTEYLGMGGYDVKGPNGNRIFLPKLEIGQPTPQLINTSLNRWSSSVRTGKNAYRLDGDGGDNDHYRCEGLFVRAVWGKNLPKFFILSFDANGGEGTMPARTFEVGVSQAIKANTFTRSGYTFTGWNTEPDGSGTTYTDGQEITLSGDLILYAQWKLFTPTYVDLGLSVKWATCNIGATAPEGYGDYFAWGETEPKSNYDWSTYKYCNGSETSLTKYNTSSDYGTIDNKTTLELSDDAARANWGEAWRMPTYNEWHELKNNCTWKWTTQNGVNGYKVTSKTNGNSIFLPAASGRYVTSVDGVGSYGRYWSSSLDSSEPSRAYGLGFNSGSVAWYVNYRSYGHTVRAVFSENDTPSTFVTLSFDANGGEGTMPAQTFEAGVSQAIPTNVFTRSGYYFVGWNTSPDGSGQSYANGEEITLSKDLTLYAQWALATGSENGHEWVDLGLPSGLKWATCNVGATAPEGYGDYFAWGETNPKDNYNWSTYKYCNGSETSLIKYNTSSDYGTVDNKTTLELTDDAARANWGGKWRMPTQAEKEELINNCTCTWTTQNGVNGYIVTSKTNGNSIFLPAAGQREGTSVYVGSYGDYWLSSLNEYSPKYACRLYFYSGSVGEFYYSGRNRGHTVRAVFSENDTPSTFVTLSFDANGGEGTMAEQLFDAGVAQNILTNKFTRSGYTFTGWNTKADGSGTSYTDKQSITLTQDITLYAQWEQEQKQVVSGTENGHDYVDLGLPSGLKWATCNIGATAPHGYGDYFAWGETAPKTNYGWSTYKHCNGSETTLTKYNTNSSNGTVDNKTTLDLSDDAARANWGGTWRMPTKVEQDELRNNCTWTWTTQNGVNGYKVTSKTNGNSIFLPAAGYRIGTSVYDDGSFYWSSSLDESYPSYAYYLYFDSGHVAWDDSYRYRGRTVRAVFSENDTPSTFVTLSFDANGGEGTMAAQYYESGVSQAIAANTFTRDGYVFNGWNTAANGSGTSYTDKQSITLSQDITLYAQWESAGGSGGGSSISGTENGHDYVDLGLPSGLKWATCNVGATTPEGYGDYFAWGETSPKDNYEWSTYKYCNGSSTTFTKYNTKSKHGTVDNKTTLELSDDAARANWGGNWRMPTRTEQDELRNNCTWTWTTQNGVNGYTVTSKTNGNSIFLPAAGYRFGTSVINVGSDGYYWSSSLIESNPDGAYNLYFNSGGVDRDTYNRYNGHAVRAVCP